MVWLSFRVIFSDFSGNVCMLRAERILKYISGEQDVRISFSSRIFFISITYLWNKFPTEHPVPCSCKTVVYSFYQEFLKVLLIVQKQLLIFMQTSTLLHFLHKTVLPCSL